MIALRTDDHDAAGAGRPQVPRRVDREAVGHAAVGAVRQVEQHAALVDPEVVVDGIGHPLPGRAVRVGDVEGALVGREPDAVGPGLAVGQQVDRAVGVETVDAVPVELGRLGRGEAVRRVGEEGGAARVVDDVVGAVEALALVAVGQRDPGAVGLDPRQAAVAVLAQHDAALEIEGQPVRAALPAGLELGQEHRVEEHARAVRLRPPVDGVGGDVAEQQVAVARIPDPHRPLDELEPVGDPLDRGIGRHQIVEPRIEPLDGSRLARRRLRRRRPHERSRRRHDENHAKADCRPSSHD